MTNQVVNDIYYLLYNYLPSLSYPLDHESKSFLLLPVFLFGCLHYIINRQNLDDVPTLHVQKEFSRMERFPKNAFNDWFHNKTFLLRHMSWNKSHNLVKWTLVESTINSQFDNSMFQGVNRGVEVCFFFYFLYKTNIDKWQSMLNIFIHENTQFNCY